VVGLVGTVGRNVQVLRLGVSEDSQLDIEAGQMSAGNLLVEFFRKNMDAEREFLRGRPQSDLGKSLIGKGTRHDPRGMSGGASRRMVETISMIGCY